MEGKEIWGLFWLFVFFFFLFPITLNRSVSPRLDCTVCVQSERSICSPVCPSVCVNVRGFIVLLLQKEVGSRTGHRVTGRSERNRARGEAGWVYNKC